MPSFNTMTSSNLLVYAFVYSDKSYATCYTLFELTKCYNVSYYCRLESFSLHHTLYLPCNVISQKHWLDKIGRIKIQEIWPKLAGLNLAVLAAILSTV